MKTKLRSFTLITLAAVALAGCKTNSHTPYISPRVTGRVLNQQTHQPIQGVTVRRVTSGQVADTSTTPHGGEVMMQAPIVQTGRDGEFMMDSTRDVSLFKRSGWYSVTLSFDQTGYERNLTTYTLKNATNTPTGEPWVKTGDILLKPLSK